MSKSIFKYERVKKPSFSLFDLSHENKLSLNMSDLVPILCKECLPGDRISLSAEVFMRMLPLRSPVMHRCNVFVHHFFVPNRLLFSDWEKFITGGTDGVQAAELPFLHLQGSREKDVVCFQNHLRSNGLADYLGLPTSHWASEIVNGDYSRIDVKFNLLPFAAYLRIYEDYYRDQNLMPSVFDTPLHGGEYLLADARDSSMLHDLFQLRKRCWEHDYFTSALPWAQRGPEVHLPTSSINNLSVTPAPNTNKSLTVRGQTGELYILEDNERSFVHLDDSGLGTINDLRRASALQRWLERNARGGARYFEQILSHFGVKSPDSRLQRAEYLGGQSQSMNISEVLQTSETSESSPQASMAGHGLSASGGRSISYRVQEHGFIMSILSVMPRTAYRNGMDRMFFREDRFDYAFPEFAGLGEQEIKRKEVVCSCEKSERNNETFGYTPRYADWKTAVDQLHGDFRGNLAFWTFARDIEFPYLTSDFVIAQPSHLPFAVVDPQVHKLLSQIYFHFKVSRALPRQGVTHIL